MRCSKVRDYLNRGMDEQLPPDVTVGLTNHLDKCEACLAFREDLMVSRRLIAATNPEISENFEWKLQLKLNQALQQVAGEAAYPWEENAVDRWHWLRNFGAASAVGLAAVLALAMFIDPGFQGGNGQMAAESNTTSTALTASPSLVGADRLPLMTKSSSRGLYQSGLQRSVSTSAGQRFNSGGQFLIEGGWSGGNPQDLLTIQRLKSQNQQLNTRLFLYQKEIQNLRTRLDSGDSNTLDLEQE